MKPDEHDPSRYSENFIVKISDDNKINMGDVRTVTYATGEARVWRNAAELLKRRICDKDIEHDA